MKRKLYFVTLTIIIMLISCNEDTYNAEVETELIQYFNQFESEAALRNVHVDMDIVNVSGYIENINDRGVLGQCKSYSDGTQTVIIDDNYWDDASDSEKEYIIFHELGHCVLGREHNDEENENGVCLSIMQSGANRCRGLYNRDNREALLDELFKN